MRHADDAVFIFIDTPKAFAHLKSVARYLWKTTKRYLARSNKHASNALNPYYDPYYGGMIAYGHPMMGASGDDMVLSGLIVAVVLLSSPD
nr:hypothetical protein [Tanacetum cinerariifolium]